MTRGSTDTAVNQTASIQRLVAREILDSRGRPTVEVEVQIGRAHV